MEHGLQRKREQQYPDPVSIPLALITPFHAAGYSEEVGFMLISVGGHG